jgi:hypothetical protein
MKSPLGREASLRRQALNTFLRARNLPPGPHRDELRQLAYGLLRIYRLGMRANVLFSSIDRMQ